MQSSEPDLSSTERSMRLTDANQTFEGRIRASQRTADALSDRIDHYIQRQHRINNQGPPEGQSDIDSPRSITGSGDGAQLPVPSSSSSSAPSFVDSLDESILRDRIDSMRLEESQENSRARELNSRNEADSERRQMYDDILRRWSSNYRRQDRSDNRNDISLTEMTELLSRHSERQQDEALHSAIILRQLERNQSLRDSNDISRRRRPWNYGRSSASENRRARFGQYISALSDSLLSSDPSASRSRGRSENIHPPFHATRGSQISIGSTFRTARFHSQLRQTRSTSSSLRSAPCLFSAFTTESTWGVMATPNPSPNPTLPLNSTTNDPLSNWNESFWFGITTIDPALVTSEWVHAQFENRSESLKEILYVVVKATPGKPLELFQEAEPISDQSSTSQRTLRQRTLNLRQINQRRGSIGAITFPTHTESYLEHLSAGGQKFEYTIRVSANGERTIQISSGSDSLSNHSTGRVRFDSSLPVYGFVMLCETISHCEILSDSTSSRSVATDATPYGINTLLNEVSRLRKVFLFILRF